MKFFGLIFLLEIIASLQAEIITKASECEKANNTLGSCSCDGQLFVGEECSKGFYCQPGNDFFTGYPYDGCEKNCAEGEVLIVDPRSQDGADWFCSSGGLPGPDTKRPMICPGKMNTECGCNASPEACPIGECDCEGQLRVSQDCKTAMYCDSPIEEGFKVIVINCTAEDEIVFVNMWTNSWKCSKDDGRCPGAFHVGCEPDPTSPTEEPTTTDPSRCTLATNSLGSCGCGEQLFINDDCTKGFYCMSEEEFPTPEDAANFDGCEIECNSNEILLVDPRNGGSWSCVPKLGPMPLVCPGKFHTECGCNEGPEACPIGECECDGQLRVAQDCREARYCNGTVEEGFDYEDLSCPEENQIVYVNLISLSWYCGVDDGRCPGSFQVGCEPETTTTTPDSGETTTTTPDSGETTSTTPDSGETTPDLGETTTTSPDSGSESTRISNIVYLLLAGILFRI